MAKKEYDIFLNGIDNYGKEGIEVIANEIKSKILEEIKNYIETFWKLIYELPEWQRILKNKEKREKFEKQSNHNSLLITQKCENIIDDGNRDENLNDVKTKNRN